MPPNHGEWSVTVFARNEGTTIGRCLAAIVGALGERRAAVTLILNGCTDDTVRRLRGLAPEVRARLAAFEIGFADKANAWNQFVYRLRPQASVYFFVDAYAIIEADGLERLASLLESRPSAHAVAAVPSCGRNARGLRQAMLRQGGLHGSFHALRAAFVERICERNIRIPVGLYRGDGILGSMAFHDLNPTRHEWNPSRVAIADQVTWFNRPLSPFRWEDIKRQWNRMIQQERGLIQIQAMKARLYRDGYEALPEFADPVTLEWIAEAPERAKSLCRSPFGMLALRRMRQFRIPAHSELLPHPLPLEPELGTDRAALAAAGSR